MNHIHFYIFPGDLITIHTKLFFVMGRSSELNFTADYLNILIQGLSFYDSQCINFTINFVLCFVKWNIGSLCFSQLPVFLGGECICSLEGSCLRPNRDPWINNDIMKVVQCL